MKEQNQAETWKDKVTCIIDGACGIYVPKEFALRFPSRIQEKDRKVLLAGPDHEEYWDVWDDVLGSVTIIDTRNMEWSLFQDGDLFAVREDVTDKEREEWQGC